jgi:hypothetical protein
MLSNVLVGTDGAPRPVRARAVFWRGRITGLDALEKADQERLDA